MAVKIATPGKVRRGSDRPSAHTKSTSNRYTAAPIDVTRREVEAVLAIIEWNATRIERLEDVVAMHAEERAQVKQEIGAIKALL
jgi:hypothetical protein